MSERRLGKAYTSAVVEPSYAGAVTPTLPGDEVWLAQALEITEDHADLPADYQTPNRFGAHQGSKGKADFGANGKFYLTGLSVANANSRPRLMALLRMLCFADLADFAAGPPAAIYADLLDAGFSSTRLTHLEFEAQGGQGNSYALLGCRANGTINIPANEPVSVDFQAKSKSLTRGTFTSTPPALVYEDTESETRERIVNKGTTASFTTVEASPVSVTGEFIEGTIDLGNELIVTDSSEDDNGIGEVEVNAIAPTGSFTVVSLPQDTYDLYSLMKAQTPMRAVLTFKVPDDANETFIIDLYYRITAVQTTMRNGVAVDQFNWQGLTRASNPGTSLDPGIRPNTCLRLGWTQAP